MSRHSASSTAVFIFFYYGQEYQGLTSFGPPCKLRVCWKLDYRPFSQSEYKMSLRNVFIGSTHIKLTIDSTACVCSLRMNWIVIKVKLSCVYVNVIGITDTDIASFYDTVMIT